MATIQIRRRHGLAADDARARLEQAAESLRTELGMTIDWQDSQLRFNRSGASGHVDLDAETVALSLDLQMPLSLMSGHIEAAIRKRLDAVLGPEEA